MSGNGLWHYETPDVRIRKICVGPLENNVYLVSCVSSGHGVIVDAAAEPERILAAAAGVDVQAVLTTHGHYDHVGAVDEVTSALDIPFRIHPADATMAGRTPDAPLAAGPIAVGDVTIHARHTPGHTPGSMCFVIEQQDQERDLPGVVLTGDTLFPGGPGGTRGTFDRILESIEHHLFDLDPATLVFPGHGLDTTIATESPSLAAWRKRGW